MAIRIRKVIKNYKEELVALCAAETDPKIDDLFYLDDNVHHALSQKFEADFKKMGFWRSEDKGSIKEIIERGRIPATSLIGILSVLSNDETTVELEKDKKYRFTELEIAELMDEINRWRENIIRQKRALEDKIAELTKSAIQTNLDHNG